MVLDSIRKEAQLCQSSGSDGNVPLPEAIFRVVTAHLNSVEISQKRKKPQENLACLNILSCRFKMEIRVVLFVCSAIKIIFRNMSRWFAALNLPLLDWKRVCII